KNIGQAQTIPQELTMHTEATRTSVRRLVCLGALCGVVVVAGLDAAQARDGANRRFFRGLFRRDNQNQQGESYQNAYGAREQYASKTLYAPAGPYGVYQIQNQQDEFGAAEKEQEFEEPAAKQPAQKPDFAADEKEKEPEEPAEPWTLTNLFTNTC